MTTTQKYKLAVAAIISFTVTLKLHDETTTRLRTFSFDLVADRISQDQMFDEIHGENRSRPVADLLKEHVIGWRNQTLVLDNDTGQPAEFSPEAFDAMLSGLGVPQAILAEYASACGVKGKVKN